MEARRKRRLGRLNPPSRKNSDRGEIVLGSLEILTPFPSCCFFSSTRLFGFLVERAQTIMILLDFITGYYRRCEVCIL